MEIQIEAKYTSVTKVTYLYGYIYYIRVHIYVFIGFYIYNIQLQMVSPFLVSDK